MIILAASAKVDALTLQGIDYLKVYFYVYTYIELIEKVFDTSGYKRYGFFQRLIGTATTSRQETARVFAFVKAVVGFNGCNLSFSYIEPVIGLPRLL